MSHIKVSGNYDLYLKIEESQFLRNFFAELSSVKEKLEKTEHEKLDDKKEKNKQRIDEIYCSIVSIHNNLVEQQLFNDEYSRFFGSYEFFNNMFIVCKASSFFDLVLPVNLDKNDIEVMRKYLEDNKNSNVEVKLPVSNELESKYNQFKKKKKKLERIKSKASIQKKFARDYSYWNDLDNTEKHASEEINAGEELGKKFVLFKTANYFQIKTLVESHDAFNSFIGELITIKESEEEAIDKSLSKNYKFLALSKCREESKNFENKFQLAKYELLKIIILSNEDKNEEAKEKLRHMDLHFDYDVVDWFVNTYKDELVKLLDEFYNEFLISRNNGKILEEENPDLASKTYKINFSL